MRRNKLSPKQIKAIYKANVRKVKCKIFLERNKIFFERLSRLLD